MRQIVCVCLYLIRVFKPGTEIGIQGPVLQLSGKSMLKQDILCKKTEIINMRKCLYQVERKLKNDEPKRPSRLGTTASTNSKVALEYKRWS